MGEGCGSRVVECKPKPLHTLEKIRSANVGVERDAEALLGEFLARQAIPSRRGLRVYADSSVFGGYED